MDMSGDQQRAACYRDRNFQGLVDRREYRAADEQNPRRHQQDGEMPAMFAQSAPTRHRGSRSQRQEQPDMDRFIRYQGDRQQGGHPWQHQTMDQTEKGKDSTQKIGAEMKQGSREHAGRTKLQQCCILMAPIEFMQLCCVNPVNFLLTFATGTLDVEFDRLHGETGRNLPGQRGLNIRKAKHLTALIALKVRVTMHGFIQR